jgi:hypothetical protein
MARLAFRGAMMERDRKREGLRVCRAARLVGVSVREYREIVSGDRLLSLQAYRRICKLYGRRRGSSGDRLDNIDRAHHPSPCEAALVHRGSGDDRLARRRRPRQRHGRNFETSSSSTTVMLAGHGLEWSHVHARREWHRMNLHD